MRGFIIFSSIILEKGTLHPCHRIFGTVLSFGCSFYFPITFFSLTISVSFISWSFFPSIFLHTQFFFQIHVSLSLSMSFKDIPWMFCMPVSHHFTVLNTFWFVTWFLYTVSSQMEQRRHWLFCVKSLSSLYMTNGGQETWLMEAQ